MIPGPVQTEDYARAVIRAGQPYLSADEAERKVAARMDRQQIFQRETGRPRLWEVIHEGALRQMIGSPEIRRVQLDRLQAASSSTEVLLQVLPFSAYDDPGTDGPIRIFEFANAPATAYTECNGGGMIVEAPDQVASLMTAMNLIRAAALSPRGSLPGRVLVRDTTQHGDGPVLSVSPSDWQRFTASIR
ncbi:MAG: transcriptional regulator [Actinomycetia bacterium]|nr:transcriptional regulator [Actinomycetes bacterium]